MYLNTLLLLVISLVNFCACKEPAAEKRFSGANRTLAATQSGVWRGFWIQNGNRGEMNLDLNINNFVINGGGTDMVGRFTLQGDYNEEGLVNITKQYLGLHSVHYKGNYQNNLIKGQWFIYSSNDRGDFEIGWFADGGR